MTETFHKYIEDLKEIFNVKDVQYVSQSNTIQVPLRHQIVSAEQLAKVITICLKLNFTSISGKRLAPMVNRYIFMMSRISPGS